MGIDKDADFNPTSKVIFVHDRLTGGIIARLPESTLSLAWYPGSDGGGYVTIGLHFRPGGVVTRVTNYRYEYAESGKAFKALAKAFAVGDLAARS